MIPEYYLQAIAAGKLTFGHPIGPVWMSLGVVLLIALAVTFYWRTTRPVSVGWRSLLIGLRSATFLLLAFCLLEPGVMLSEVIPQETYVAVLVDDSQSMSIADQVDGTTRQDQTLELLYRKDKVVEQLSSTFQVRTYRFSDIAERVTGEESFDHLGTTSNITAGLDKVLAELSSFPLAGLVLVSDGADNSGSNPETLALRLAEKNVPLYVVGVGQETIAKDLSVTTVTTNKSLLEGSIFSVDIGYGQQGFAGSSARLTIKQDGAIVASKNLLLTSDNEVKRVSLELTPNKKEIITYEVAIEEKVGETIVENNRSHFFIDNREKPPLDILYVEGQPRNEYKFARRAVEKDQSLRLATYLQTGPRKYLRQGINNASELENGFPKDPETLFSYEGIIFGNVERSFFNDDQLTLLKEFVAKRGGGFMLLGGVQDSFVDSSLADILPVDLLREGQLPPTLQGGARRGDHPTGATYRPHMTKQGEFSPILRLSSEDGENRELWRHMPDLEGVYVTGRAKPGASVLIEHPNLTYQNSPLPVLATQRYGRGRSVILSTASSWRWQMMLPHEDQSHERIWRQMLRWLADDSEQRISLQLQHQSYEAGQAIEVTAKLLDKKFEPVNNGLLWLQITSPSGQIKEFPMTWQLDKEGEYRFEFEAEEEGVHDLLVKAPSELDAAISAQAPLLVTSSRSEFLRAGMDSGLLKRLAVASNGKFYSLSEAKNIVDDLTFNPNSHSREVVRSLWDQPLFIILLLSLICTEWLVRRVKGLS